MAGYFKTLTHGHQWRYNPHCQTSALLPRHRSPQTVGHFIRHWGSCCGDPPGSLLFTASFAKQQPAS
ncbi:unnamed protein product [Merluccius merluccius]